MFNSSLKLRLPRNNIFCVLTLLIFLTTSGSVLACQPENYDHLKNTSKSFCSPNTLWCLKIEPQQDWGLPSIFGKLFVKKEALNLPWTEHVISRESFSSMIDMGRFYNGAIVQVNNSGWRAEKYGATISLYNPEGSLVHQFNAAELMPKEIVEDLLKIYSMMRCRIPGRFPWVYDGEKISGLEFIDDRLIVRTYNEATYKVLKPSSEVCSSIKEVIIDYKRSRIIQSWNDSPIKNSCNAAELILQEAQTS